MSSEDEFSLHIGSNPHTGKFYIIGQQREGYETFLPETEITIETMHAIAKVLGSRRIEDMIHRVRKSGIAAIRAKIDRIEAQQADLVALRAQLAKFMETGSLRSDGTDGSWAGD